MLPTWYYCILEKRTFSSICPIDGLQILRCMFIWNWFAVYLHLKKNIFFFMFIVHGLVFRILPTAFHKWWLHLFSNTSILIVTWSKNFIVYTTLFTIVFAHNLVYTYFLLCSNMTFHSEIVTLFCSQLRKKQNVAAKIIRIHGVGIEHALIIG